MQVTVLDIPVIGDDRGHAATIVERLRGVSTVFVSLPDLAGPDDVYRLAPVVAAFR